MNEEEKEDSRNLSFMKSGLDRRKIEESESRKAGVESFLSI